MDKTKTILITILICSVCLVMIGCANTPSQEQIRTADYGAYPTNYKEIVKDYYSRTLFDPYSAHYRWIKEPYKGYLTYYSVWEKPKFGYLVHIGVNAKNRYGAYVGEEEQSLLIKNGRIIGSLDGQMVKN